MTLCNWRRKRTKTIPAHQCPLHPEHSPATFSGHHLLDTSREKFYIHFQGERWGAYSLKPRAAGFLPAPPPPSFIRPRTPRTVLSGFGGWGCIKFVPVVHCLDTLRTLRALAALAERLSSEMYRRETCSKKPTLTEVSMAHRLMSVGVFVQRPSINS